MIDTSYLVARALGFAMCGSARPVATLFCVQLGVMASVKSGKVDLPDELGFAVSWIALALGAAGALLELLLHHTPDADELVRSLHADKLVNALLTVPTTLLLCSLTALGDTAVEQAGAATVAAINHQIPAANLDMDDVQALVTEGAERLDAAGVEAAYASPEAEDLALALQTTHSSGRPIGEQAAILGAALALNLLLTWVRGEAREFVSQLHFDRLWAWVESGGVLVGVVLLALAPVIGLVFMLALSAVGVTIMGLWRLGGAAMDRARRTSCPACNERIRQEASVCKACRVAVTPMRWLVNAPPANPAASGGRESTA